METAPTRGWNRPRAICAAILLVEGVYQLVLLFTTPALLGSHPVLLEALRGSTPALVAGGAFARVGRASLAVVLLVPLPALMMSDPFVWWAGRLWGPSVVELLAGRGASERRGVKRAIRFIERGRSWAVLVAPILPVPNAIIYAAAGWTGMRFRRFIVLDLIGTFTWVALIVGLGYALGHSAVHVAHQITHYSLLITLGLVVVTVGLATVRGQRAGRGPRGDAGGVRPDESDG